MHNKILSFAVVVGALAFSGVALGQFPFSTRVAHVTVHVSSSGDVRCEPDVVHVKEASTLIKFRLVGDGFAFASENAIEVDSPGADFPERSWTVEPNLATLLDVRAMKGTHKYTVHLVNLFTGEALDYDPQIVNEK